MRRAQGSIATETGDERAERRFDLLDAAHRVIRRDGPAASMDDVATEAGITKPILYRHFGNKGGLYRALAERYVGALLAARRRIVKQHADPKTRVRATIDAYLEFVESDPQIYRFLSQHARYERPEADGALADYIRTLASEISLELEAGLDEWGGDPAAAQPWAYGIIGFVQMATDWWMEEPTMARADFVDHLAALLWDGLARASSDGKKGKRRAGNE